MRFLQSSRHRGDATAKSDGQHDFDRSSGVALSGTGSLRRLGAFCRPEYEQYHAPAHRLQVRSYDCKGCKRWAASSVSSWWMSPVVRLGDRRLEAVLTARRWDTNRP